MSATGSAADGATPAPPVPPPPIADPRTGRWILLVLAVLFMLAGVGCLLARPSAPAFLAAGLFFAVGAGLFGAVAWMNARPAAKNP